MSGNNIRAGMTSGAGIHQGRNNISGGNNIRAGITSVANDIRAGMIVLAL